MSVKMIYLDCPKCNATINLDSNLEFGFCQYCGAKVFLSDTNKFTYRIIDDAAVLREQNRRREIEIAREERIRREQSSNKLTKVTIVWSVIFVIAYILAYAFGLFS